MLVGGGASVFGLEIVGFLSSLRGGEVRCGQSWWRPTPRVVVAGVDDGVAACGGGEGVVVFGWSVSGL